MRLIEAESLKIAIALDYFSGKKTLGHIIDDTPTAYDIDKVVEELKKTAVYPNLEVDAQFVELNEVIKIVKAGGKNEGIND